MVRSGTYFNVLAVVFILILFLDSKLAFGARLGGAYYVDDAEIGKSGSCEIETWSSFAPDRRPNSRVQSGLRRGRR
jgi:hypothetical protein